MLSEQTIKRMHGIERERQFNAWKQGTTTQSRKYSLIESITNVCIGYGIALLSQIIVFPFFNIQVSIKENIYIGLWFTGISILRSFVLRRAFNSIKR